MINAIYKNPLLPLSLIKLSKNIFPLLNNIIDIQYFYITESTHISFTLILFQLSNFSVSSRFRQSGFFLFFLHLFHQANLKYEVNISTVIILLQYSLNKSYVWTYALRILNTEQEKKWNFATR